MMTAIYTSSQREDWENNRRFIYVLDSSGALSFRLDTDSWVDHLIHLNDGRLAFLERTYSEGGATHALRPIDTATKAFGATINIPDIGYNIYNSNGEYDVLLGDNDSMYGFKFGDEEATKILSWLDSDIINNGLENIFATPDGRIICTQITYNRYTSRNNTEIFVLTKTPYSELPEKTIITLAAFGAWNLREAVVAFNRTNTEYRVELLEYANTSATTPEEYTAGLTQLTAEITAGKYPDILAVSSLPYEEYARKGMFVDLYPYIDSDPKLSRSDLIESAFRAAEIDGKLYQIFPSFNILTILGSPDILGRDSGWTIEEFQEVIDNNPAADMPLGQGLTKEVFLQASIMFNINDYIDWSTNTVHFNTPYFIKLLQYCNSLPASDNIDYDNYISEDEAIPAGRQIMVATGVADFYELQYYKHLFGGEYVFKGFPNANGRGNSLSANNGLAIFEKSPHKDAAWSFVSTILNKENQINNYSWGLPTNREAFDIKVNEALQMQPGSHNYNGIYIDVPTQADIDKVIDLINTAQGSTGYDIDSAISDIIMEETSDFFKGLSTAESTAQSIQSKLSLLVSERS